MPNYNMNSLVIGGIGYHRFLIIKNHNKITPVNNRRFHDDIGDWTCVGTSVITRVADTETQFGNYCLKIVDDNAAVEEYAEFDIELGEIVASKKYAVYFWAKASAVGTGNIHISTPDENLGNQDIGLTTIWKPYIIVKSASAGTGTILRIRFKPYADADGVGGTGIMHIDNVCVYEIENDYKLRPATTFVQTWEELIDANYRLLTNDNKVYPNGAIYNANLSWDFLEPPEELVKHKIFAAKKLLFMPHLDYNWAILVRNDGKNVRNYFMNKYIGHQGNINLKGLEILESDPPEMPSGVGGSDNVGSGLLTMDDVIIA